MRKSSCFRSLTLILATFLWGSLFLPLNVNATEITTIQRLAGPTKNQTAIEIALKINPGIVPAVILATPMSYPDALVGIPLGIQQEAPLLWVGKTPQDSEDVLQFIDEHCDKKGTIYILGGEGVIPKSFESALQKIGFEAEQVQRLGGNNRYETAVKVAQKVEYKGNPIYITAGEDYGQAASTAVLAAAKESPILLVPSKGNIPEGVINYLNQRTSDKELSLKIVGDTSVIPEAKLVELKSKVKGLELNQIERIDGSDLYTLMENANKQTWMNKEGEKNGAIDRIFLVTGKSYADGLPGAILAAFMKAPLVFIDGTLPAPSTSLLTAIYDFNQKKDMPTKDMIVLGGVNAISPQLVTEVDSFYSRGESLAGKAQVWTYAQLDPFSVPTFGVKGEGYVYLTDTYSQTLQVINAEKKVTTLAGKTSTVDDYGMPVGGYKDGLAAEAMFNMPKGVAIDGKGILYLVDSVNGAIRTLDQKGNVSTLIKGLNNPTDIVMGGEGELYVTETLNHRILKIVNQGQWEVLAGGGYKTENGELRGAFADGKGEGAKFNEPQGLAIDDEGNLYVADTGNQRIRKISPEGLVTTLAGSGEEFIENTPYYLGGYKDGEGKTAQFNFPLGLTVDKSKTVYVADSLNHMIRKITPEGVVNTIAGIIDPGKRDGLASHSQFNTPSDILLWEDGSLLIIDQGNALLRQYIPAKK